MGAWTPRVPRASAWIVLGVLLLGGFHAVLHPLGDAPDEAEDIDVIATIVREGRLPLPEDRLRQSVHPPLSFVLYALASRPLEAMAPWLPEEIVWDTGLRVAVPLHQPSRIYRRDTTRDFAPGPEGFSAWTLLALRLLSVVLTALAAALCLAAGRTWLPESPRAIAGAVGALVLAPQVLLQGSSISMEPLLLLCVAWAALEMGRGLRGAESYSPVRAGIASGLATLVRHSGFVMLPLLAVVAAMRSRRVGVRRAAGELALAGSIAAAPAIGLAIWSTIRTGEIFPARRILEVHPEILRSTPVTVSDLDAWLPQMVQSFFGVGVPGLRPPQTLLLLWVVLVGACIAAGFAHAFFGGARAERRVSPRTSALFAAIALGATLALPFLGNLQFHHGSGRYLIPAIPFAVPIVAAGLLAASGLRDDARWLPSLALLPASATFVVVFFSLAPLFHLPADRQRGALAYADSGGFHDPGLARGISVRLASFDPFPSPERDAAVDIDRVEYRFELPREIEDAWLHVVLVGGSAGRTVQFQTFSPRTLDFAFPSCRISAGGLLLAEWVSPPAGPAWLGYRIPPEAFRDGVLDLAFERVGTAPFVAVAEVRIDRSAPRGAFTLGPFVRVSAADARPGIGDRLSDPEARSRFVRRAARGDAGTLCETPPVLLPPGAHRVRSGVRLREGPAGGAVGRLVVADASGRVVAEQALVFDPMGTKEHTSVRVEFEVPRGTTDSFSARIEANGAGAFDVDDLEIFGPR